MWRSIRIALLASCALVWLTVECWARAGGGGSFGGGGGGGGGGFSGGGGGGGGGQLIHLLIWLCIHHPLIGYPVVAGLVALVIFSASQGETFRKNRVIRRGLQKQRHRLMTEAIEQIQARDPDFEMEAFLERAGVAFRKIQDAWSQQDLTSVRAFISDGIRERFTLQIGIQKAEGIRNVMDRVEVLNASSAAVFCDDSFDTIHVQFRAKAVDYDVDLESNRKVRGSKSADEFTEVWSFHRRPGARTRSGEGAIEGSCPRCGSPLQIVDTSKCPSCDALVNSGEYDWVLAEISQESEWSVPPPTGYVPGLETLKQQDPALNSQHLEDRVSVMFWRLRAAEFYGDAAYAAPILSPSYRETFLQDLRQRGADGEFWKEPATGRVDVLGYQPGGPGEPDRVHVKVRWSGIRMHGQPEGRSSVLRPKTIYTHVYILMRQQNVKTIPQSTFASAGCPSCGAPLEVNRTGNCNFCGSDIVDGQFDWVLEDVQPFTSQWAFGPDTRPVAHVNSHHAQLEQERSDPYLSLAVLARVMLADHHLDSKERAALDRLAERRGMTKADVDELLASGEVTGSGIPVPSDAREAREHLEQLVHAVLADGIVSRREKKLLTNYAEHVGLSSADVKLAINEERAATYRLAREELKRKPRTGRSGDARSISS